MVQPKRKEYLIVNFQIYAVDYQHLQKAVDIKKNYIESKYYNDLKEYLDLFLIEYPRDKSLINANLLNSINFINFSIKFEKFDYENRTHHINLNISIQTFKKLIGNTHGSFLKHHYFDHLSEQTCPHRTNLTKCDHNGIILCRDSRKINPPKCDQGE
ncbi:hypothetical protein HZS_2231 [Henneguya salminicola]|nr:hypothetical protein HZS_2231 [Henneguya salminicola]